MSLINSAFFGLIFFSLASTAVENEKVKKAEKREPAGDTDTIEFLNGTVKAEYEDSKWGVVYRFYDKKHKVVCYSYRSSTLSCAPSASTQN